MNPLTEGRSLDFVFDCHDSAIKSKLFMALAAPTVIMILNDFVLIMKDFYGRSPYKKGVNRYITPKINSFGESVVSTFYFFIISLFPFILSLLKRQP